jgi:uncharacterized damage-inducible protein DinB
VFRFAAATADGPAGRRRWEDAMSMTAAFLQEYEHEAKTTRRVLERVPQDKLTWKPHPKSMSLGYLAMHIATAQGACAGWTLHDSTDFAAGGDHPGEPSSVAEILAAHDRSVESVKQTLTKVGDEGLQKMWSGKMGDQTLMTIPKAVVVRNIVLNHIYHHRGQLSVYLRLLDVPVPAIYGPSADENPFAARV